MVVFLWLWRGSLKWRRICASIGKVHRPHNLCNSQGVLLLDCAPVHMPRPVMQAAKKSNIQLIYVPASTTHTLQPLRSLCLCRLQGLFEKEAPGNPTQNMAWSTRLRRCGRSWSNLCFHLWYTFVAKLWFLFIIVKNDIPGSSRYGQMFYMYGRSSYIIHI